ncbi:MAG TPA: hypothetical protein VMT31_00870 [Methanomicrobiales archaeon]|jgi:hypothetical protein|nr:hypothetical protein [Methanomicrobiales archaeon]
MKGTRFVPLLIILGILAPAPSAALQADYLDITVDRTGDATVTFEYTLSFVEGILAFFGAVGPGQDLGKVMAAASGGEVGHLAESAGSASFPVTGFAAVSGSSPNATYRTPVINLSWAEEGWEASVLAPLLAPDFSPRVTIIRFPDAYSVTFHDELVIPNTTHTF